MEATPQQTQPQEQPIQPRSSGGTFIVSLTGALFIMGQGFDPIAILLNTSSTDARQQPSFRFSREASGAREDFEATKFRINRLINEAREAKATRSGGQS